MNAPPTDVWTGRDERGGGALLAVEFVLNMVYRIELVRDLARTTSEIVARAGILHGRDDFNLHAMRQSAVPLKLELQCPCDAFFDSRLRQRAVVPASPSHTHSRLTNRFLAHVATSFGR